MQFRVDLTTYRGPLELLLYLVRKQEIDVTEISLARLTEQFLEQLTVLQELGVDDVGDFVDMASCLLELKSHCVLPGSDEAPDVLEDPREGLVQRLLEYKRYRDAASLLDEQSREWQQRYPRVASDLPPRQTDLGTQPLQEVELWDLVSALGRILRDNQATQPSNIVYDDTPLQVYMERILRQLASRGDVTLSQMYEPGMPKSAMIGVFLAILELVRHHSVRTEQHVLHGEIRILPGEPLSTRGDDARLDVNDRQPGEPAT
jgi:segregation and condensation protein A